MTRLSLPHTVTTNKRGGPVNARTGAANCPYCGKLISLDRRCQHVEDVEPPNVLVLDPDAPPLQIITTEVQRIAVASDGFRYATVALEAIAELGQATTIEIAELIGRPVKKVSAALTDLVRDGLVEMSHRPNDRRTGIYALTERGRRKVAA